MAFLSAQWTAALVELPTLTFHHALLPLSIFSALHGIRVSMGYRQAIEAAAQQSLKDGSSAKPTRVPWGQALLSVLAMSLGGGFSASILLGMPPSWLGSNVVVPTYALSFFLIQYTFVYDLLQQMVPPAVLDSVLIVADGSLRALSIAKLGVDGSRMRFAADSHQAGSVSEPWFAMLLLGMIAGSGGGMWADFLKLKTHHWTLSTPTFVQAATYDMKAALLSALFYATSTSPQVYQTLLQSGYGHSGDETYSGIAKGGLLESQDAKAMTMLVMCTLLLGKRAEATVVRLTGVKGGPSTWIQSLSSRVQKSTVADKERNDSDSSDQEQIGLNRIDREEDETYQSMRRRAVLNRHDEEEEEEEEEVVSSKKNARGGRKKASGKKQGSPSPLPAEVPLTRSTRLRKPTRQEL